MYILYCKCKDFSETSLLSIQIDKYETLLANLVPKSFIWNKNMPQAGFEPGAYGILSTWIWDSALDHSATTWFLDCRIIVSTI